MVAHTWSLDGNEAIASEAMDSIMFLHQMFHTSVDVW
jgi:hypothetical protein